MPSHIKNPKLAPLGKKKILWAEREMPVLLEIKKRFEKFKPLKNIKIAACLHVTPETANLMQTLKAGGAQVTLCASNPLSTQDEVAASLVRDFQIPVFAIKGENKATYYRYLQMTLGIRPDITLDDGADLLSLLHSQFKKLTPKIKGSMEETTTGVIRLKALEKEKKLLVPIIAVNEAKTKNLFDNRYGTGQSTIDGILRATNILLAGKTFVIAGYGWCGKGLAMRAKGMGAKVIITETNPIRALEAAMDGFSVMNMSQAAKIGDIFCTVTGNINIIDKIHFNLMKDGAILCNAGHFNVEINISALKKMSKKITKNIRNYVDEYVLKNGKKLYLLGEGRLINLVAAEGHPATVMDMSFSTQALCAEYVVKNYKKLEKKVYEVPEKIENWIAKTKLKSMGIKIDKLTSEQRRYLSSWETGT